MVTSNMGPGISNDVKSNQIDNTLLGLQKENAYDPAQSNTEQYLARNIKRLRKQMGLTQQELAEKIYVAKTAVGNYEDTGKNHRNPSVETLTCLADELACGANCILYGSAGYHTIDIKQRLLSEAQALHFIRTAEALEAINSILTECEQERVLEDVFISDAAWRTAMDYHQCCPRYNLDRIVLNMLRDCDRQQYDKLIGKHYQLARLKRYNPELLLSSDITIPYKTFATDDIEEYV